MIGHPRAYPRYVTNPLFYRKKMKHCLVNISGETNVLPFANKLVIVVER